MMFVLHMILCVFDSDIHSPVILYTLDHDICLPVISNRFLSRLESMGCEQQSQGISFRSMGIR